MAAGSNGTENGGGAATARGGGGNPSTAEKKKIFASIKEATCASDEDIQYMLAECDGDVNETVSRLLDNPFEQVQTKKDRRTRRADGPPPQQRGDRRDAPPGQKYPSQSRGGYSGGRGGGGRGGRGDRDRPPSGGRSGPPTGAKPAGPPASAMQKSPAPAPTASSPQAPVARPPVDTSVQPPPIRPAVGAPGLGGTSFTDILRRNAKPVQPPPYQPPAAGTAPPLSPEIAPPVEEDLPPPLPAPQAAPAQPSFAEKLSAAAAAAANEPEQPAPMTGMPTSLPVGYQQAPAAPEPSTTDLSANAWGSKTADIQTVSLAGLLSGKTEEDKSSSVLQMPPAMSTSTAADSLSLQFGQFGMGGAGIGDFGAGFGSGFGDDLGAVDAQVPGPASTAVQAPESDPQHAPESAPSYQPSQQYSYGQPPSATISSLGQAPKPESSSPVTSSAPAPYYNQPSMYQLPPQPPPPAPSSTPFSSYSGMDEGKSQQTASAQGMLSGSDASAYQLQQPGRGAGGVEDYPASSAPAALGKADSGRTDSTGFGSSQDPATSSAPAVSAPAAAAAPVQPVVPQIPTFPGHQMPPSIAAQYGYMHHHQYPYMHSANMYMYPNPYPHYAGGAAYPPQAGSTNFPPSVGSTNFPGQGPSATGPVKYPNYPQYAQNSNPPASGLAPGGYGSYSTPGSYGTEESGSGQGYSKDSKDSLYGPAGSQGQPQMALRDSPYAAYMQGQGYQQQGYGTAAAGQYSSSAYGGQYMQPPAPYALGGQMPPPNMQGGSQGGGGGGSGTASTAPSTNMYKLQ